jgi:uncharacterized protein (UPF0218 family)
LILPSEVRRKVKNIPSGKLINTDDEFNKIIKNKLVIAIGDVVSERLFDLGKQADISIVDFKTKRKKISSKLVPDITVTNKPGTINRNAVASLKKSLNHILKNGGKQTMRIIGEEDLMPLPATLLAPLGALILYGMPDKGAVAVEVNEDKKREVMIFLSSVR